MLNVVEILKLMILFLVSTLTKTTGAPSQTSQNMMTMLQKQKGFVTITDILTLCIKPPKPKFIRVPGSSDDDANFTGYDTLEELLDSLGVEIRKVRQCCFFFRFSQVRSKEGPGH